MLYVAFSQQTRVSGLLSGTGVYQPGLLTSLLPAGLLVALGPRWSLGRLGEPQKPLNAKISGQAPAGVGTSDVD